MAAGESLREIWFALCEALDVPAERRWGRQERVRDRP